MIIDSGERREFKTGAVRDIQEGKGRCDLLPLRECAELLGCNKTEDPVLMDIDFFMQTKDTKFLIEAIIDFVDMIHTPDKRIITPCEALLQVAIHFEEGAKKYGERNWEKGIPLHCYIDSGVRHYLKWRSLYTDEDHGRAFIWNMLCGVWTLRNHPELDDIVFPETEPKKAKVDYRKYD